MMRLGMFGAPRPNSIFFGYDDFRNFLIKKAGTV
jgi:hypothetical protein